MNLGSSSVLTNVLGNILPSTTDIAQNVLLGAGTTIFLSGFTSQAGQNALDPLHLFAKQTNPPATQAGAPVSVAAPVPSVTGAAFAAMPAASQAALLAAGVHIV